LNIKTLKGGEKRMKYLVNVEAIESGAIMNPQDVIQNLERVIVPSVKMMIDWEKNKKILAGGVFVGAKEGVAVIEADSHDECGRMLQSLPFWPQYRWKVTPLENFDDRLKQIDEMLGRLKQ
jgi:hypothetical protein